MTRFCIFACIAVLCLAGTVFGQTYDTLKVATYNVLNYPNLSSTRDPYLRTVLAAIDPDILVTQEQTTSAGCTTFLTDVLNNGGHGTYAAAPWSDGPDTDNMMYYKTSKVTFVGPVTVLSTELRDINGYRLRPIGISADSLDIQIYSAHLKANDTGPDAAQRGREATVLRNYLNSQTAGYFFACGDWNLYTSDETAYHVFVDSTTSNVGRLFDPVPNPIGNWSDASAFAAIHTQSPRLGTVNSDGGSTGGLDDRFDFVLPSKYFQNAGGWDYVTNSYTAYGNDGNHLNQSVNVLPNTAVSETIANALYYGTDHLPVFLKIRRQTSSGATLTVTSPNSGEIWYTGESRNITWNSTGVTGNVTVKLNRTYSGGAWETLFAGTANDGTQAWTVTGPGSTTARVQITSDNQPTVSDVSDANFTISVRNINVTAPNGGEVWGLAQVKTITWTSAGLSGNLKIELNRTYPSGTWETLFGVVANTGSQNWTISGATSTQARIRISSLNTPTVGDTSAANFTIGQSLPPVVTCDPHGDALPGSVVFTAKVTDDYPGSTAKLFYRMATAMSFDSLAMTADGYPNEFSASPTLTYGRWSYFVRALDSENQPARTDTFAFVVSSPCGIALGYDDGGAEMFNWSPQDTFVWAVKFTPPQTPFVLCAAQVTIAGFHPDSSHTPIKIQVRAANGPGGTPGTILREVTRGSIGNVVGGLPGAGGYVARFFLCDDATEPLELSGDFYVAVRNPPSGTESFGLDTSSTPANRSYVYDPCTLTWALEDGVTYNTNLGNRMIRVSGWADQPNQVVVRPSGNDLILNWSRTGSVYYKIYKSTDYEFTTPTFVATVADTTLTLPGEVSSLYKQFYLVKSVSTP